jgi:anti-sigma factor RsiW
MTLYLDDELQGSERADFKSHLSGCESCRSVLESERRFLEVIRQSRPLYESTPDLRARVESLLKESEPVPAAPPHLRRRIGRSLGRLNGGRSNLFGTPNIVFASFVLFLFVVAAWVVISSRKQWRIAGPSEFALMAANTHLRHLRGQLPLEINSTAPQQISSWFHDKLPFGVQLPNYQELSGQKKLYELEGARLVGYNNDYAAYVAYQMSERPISLVITSDRVATPAGGEEIAAKGLTFHYNAINGLKVITWSDRGLTYALVSDLEERGQQSCIVCHHGSKDQDFIEPLKPK